MAMKKTFPDTVWVGDRSYADTVGFESAIPAIERVELAPEPPAQSPAPDDIPSFDWSGVLIVAGVVLILGILLAPTYSEWFREWSGISSWIHFSKNLFGWQ